MVWPMVIAAIASAALGGYNQYKTAKRQDQNAARGIAEQARLQREANALTNKQITELEGSTPKEETATRSSQIRDQLRRKQSAALAGITNTGGGDAVTELAAGARPQAVGYGDDINEWLSGMAGPVLQRQGEDFMRADTQSGLNSLTRDSAQQDFLTRLRAAGIRPNPWLSLGSDALGAYARGAGGFAGGGTIAGKGAGGLVNLGGQTPQMVYGAQQPTLPGMGGHSVYGAPGKFGIFKRT